MRDASIEAGAGELVAHDVLRELDPVLERFEDLLRSGGSPRAETFLGEVGEELRPTLLSYLLELELDYARRRSVPGSLEEYAQRFPLLPEHKQAPRSELPTSTPSGPSFGPFRLLREIGRGGMGVVYEALQLELDRRVALKIVSTSLLAEPSFRARFRQEARAVASLHHSHIVQLYEYGEHGGIPYMAMQLVEGQSLSALLATQRAIPGRREQACTRDEAREAARVGAQVASALAYAHRQGVLHRDVKPANLLLDASGEVFLGDFGLALQGEVELTRTGEILGTLRYLAPERFAGTGDARADVYALGVTLYEMLALGSPFGDSDQARLVHDVVAGAAPRLGSRRAGVPRDLEVLVHRAMASDLADRYQSADELRLELEAFLDDRPIIARPSSIYERWQRWRRKNRTLALASHALLMCVVLLVSGALYAAATFAGQSEELRRAADIEREERAKAEAAAHAQEQSLYVSELRHSFRSYHSRRNLREIQAFLDRWSTREFGGIGRGFEWELLLAELADGGQVLPDSLPGHPERGRSLSWSPDGSRLLRSRDPLHILDTSDYSEHRLSVLAEDTSSWGWNHDGSLLGIADSYGGRVIDMASGALLAHTEQPSARAIALHPRKPIVAVCHHVGNLLVKDWSTGREIFRTEHCVGTAPACFHPDGLLLAYLGQEGRIQILDLETGRSRPFTNAPHAAWDALAWHPSGRYLVVGLADRFQIYTEQGELRLEFGQDRHIPNGLCFDRSGDWLIAGRSDECAELWSFARLIDTKSRLRSGSPRLLRAACRSLAAVTMAPDGKRAAGQAWSGQVFLWDLESPPTKRSFGWRSLDGPRKDMSIAWQPDGERLWVSTRHGTHAWTRDGTWDSRVIHESRELVFHPTGRFVAHQFRAKVRVLSFPSLEVLEEYDHEPGELLCWHPTESWLVGHNGARVRLWRIGESLPPETLRFDPLEPNAIALPGEAEEGWLFGGTRLWKRSAAPSEASVSSATGEQVWLLDAISPDGRYGARIGSNEDIVVYAVGSRRESIRLTGRGDAGDLDWSPRGDRLLSFATDGTVRIWSPQHAECLAVLECGYEVSSARWSPDGDAIAALLLSGEVIIWDARRDR
ncbi:MAG: protein kinase [Planctomycetes bacterium]|nr:protein kinase [Planctomycetota bacterium]